MSMLLAYARRALSLPPREAAFRARYLCAGWWSANRQRLLAAVGGDPLAPASFAKRTGFGVHPVPATLFQGDAVLPIRWSDTVSAMDVNRVRDAAARAIEHRFDLLGSGPVRVRYGLQADGFLGVAHRMGPGTSAVALQRERMEALLPGIPHDYEPIDWHVDFRSGYRWNPSTWFAHIRYGDIAAVDVKVPWELSRFQHVGALGLAWRLDPDSEEGSRAPSEFRAQVVDWIAANPVGYGVNWSCAMDVGIRAANWLMGVALLDDAPAVDDEFRWLLARAVWTHGRHLESNLEYHHHQTGNHYLANVVSLLCIGAALPEFDDADRWLMFGLQELESEMQRQVMTDGASIEGSTAYQHLVMEMFLLGACVARRIPAVRRDRLMRHPGGRLRHPFAPALRPAHRQPLDWYEEPLLSPGFMQRLELMARFAAAVTKPDGRIPQLGDNDSGRIWLLSPSPLGAPGCASHPQDRRTVLAIAARLFGRDDWAKLAAHFSADADMLVPRAQAPIPTSETPDAAVFPQAGIATVRAGKLYLLITAGRVPHMCSGGHFHNDLLSWELQWNGCDIFVDAGSYTYTPSRELRNAWRSTAAHNTVHVDGMEQRLWPPGQFLFIVERDADIDPLQLKGNSCAGAVSYGGVRHRRRWEWTPTSLVVADDIDAGERRAEWHMTLAPGVAVTQIAPSAHGTLVRLAAARCSADVLLSGVSELTTRAALYSPGYGMRTDTVALSGTVVGGAVRATVQLRSES
jgi:hypothetical protein